MSLLLTSQPPFRTPTAPPPPRYHGSRRSELKRIAGETLAALNRGTYTVRGGIDYDLRRKIRETRQGTRFYHPNDQKIMRWAAVRRRRAQADADGDDAVTDLEGEAPAYVSVVASTTLEAVRSLEEMDVKAGADKEEEDDGRQSHKGSSSALGRIGVLSSGSPGKPGGNFQAGDEGQELSLSRSSTLYSALTSDEANKFYNLPPTVTLPPTHHRFSVINTSDPAFNTHAIVYSPGVTVFRDDIGRYTHPLDIDVLTCAAVPAPTVRAMYATVSQAQSHCLPSSGTQPRQVEEAIKRTMHERMARILFVFERREVRTLVLPAFGAGSFQNKVSVIARLWASLLTAPDARFARSFDRVIFAVMPESACEEFQRAFYRDATRMPREGAVTDTRENWVRGSGYGYGYGTGQKDLGEDKQERGDGKGKQREEDEDDDDLGGGSSLRHRGGPSLMYRQQSAPSYSSAQSQSGERSVRSFSMSYGEEGD